MKNKFYIRWDKNSIAFKFTLMFFILMILQSTLLIVTMIFGGVLSEAEESAFQSLNEKVGYQKSTIEKEMANRWTNIDAYSKEITKKIPVEATDKEMQQFLVDSLPMLVTMLRSTTTTGAFILLDADSKDHSGLYLRDYDPLLNDEFNKDVCAVIGPGDVSQRYKVPLDINWSSHLTLNDENKAFYEMPYSKAYLSTDPKLIGYWSKPFRLTEKDPYMMTYSIPLFDQQNNLRGVIGVELLMDYFNEFLPGKDFLSRDSLGFLIGYQETNKSPISPLILNGAIQKRILNNMEPFDLQSIHRKLPIYQLINHNHVRDLYTDVQKIEIYDKNTPFEQQQWYLIGLMEESKLLSLVNKIQNILLLSFVLSIFIGGITVYVTSYFFTKPIVQLARQVRGLDLESGEVLAKTGVTEIDDLSHAIELTNQNLIESTGKISQIIRLMNVPIGAFEYKENDEKVFLTDQVKSLLALEMDEVNCQKESFVRRLEQLMAHPEPEEEDVYKIHKDYEKWVHISMMKDGQSTLGIVTDVTDEILEKRQIKLDRDYDVLTQLLNRRAFKRQVQQLLETPKMCSAYLMFDLDLLKYVNDTYGHKWGDIYIATTAKHLQYFSEHYGIVSRLSGDEFAVFLYNVESKQQVRSFVQTFYKRLAENPIAFPDGDRIIRISGGLYWLDEYHTANHFDMAMQKADEALYLAKKTDKGTLKEYVEN